MTTGMPFGGFRFWWAYVDDDGYPMGSLATPNAPVQNTVYDPQHLRGGVSLGFPQSTVQQVQRLAEQKVKGKAYLGVSDLGEIALVLADLDQNWHAAASNSARDTSTVSGWVMLAPNAQQTVFPRLMIGANAKLLMEDDTVLWLTIIYNSCEVQRGLPGATQNDGDNPNNLEYTLLPNASTRTPIGALYSATSLSVQDDEDIGLMIIDDQPILLSTYIGNGAATSFKTGYLPASSAVDGSENSFFAEGSDYSGSVSAYSTTTGVATITAVTADNRLVTGYGANTNFTASP